MKSRKLATILIMTLSGPYALAGPDDTQSQDPVLQEKIRIENMRQAAEKLEAAGKEREAAHVLEQVRKATEELEQKLRDLERQKNKPQASDGDGAKRNADKPGTPDPLEFSNVTAVAKADVFFNGNVVSHTIRFPNGSWKTLGLVRPGKYHFGTAKAERLEITDGHREVTLDGTKTAVRLAPGAHINVPADSGFTIDVSAGLCQYVCSFLD